jgi:uncharacterized protein YjbJ (UPF0337 family)
VPGAAWHDLCVFRLWQGTARAHRATPQRRGRRDLATKEAIIMSSGTGDKLRGKGEELMGRGKEAMGDLTDDERMQSEGQGDQLKGKGRGMVGDVKDAMDKAGDKVGDAVDRMTGHDQSGRS